MKNKCRVWLALLCAGAFLTVVVSPLNSAYAQKPSPYPQYAKLCSKIKTYQDMNKLDSSDEACGKLIMRSNVFFNLLSKKRLAINWAKGLINAQGGAFTPVMKAIIEQALKGTRDEGKTKLAWFMMHENLLKALWFNTDLKAVMLMNYPVNPPKWAKVVSEAEAKNAEDEAKEGEDKGGTGGGGVGSGGSIPGGSMGGGGGVGGGCGNKGANTDFFGGQAGGPSVAAPDPAGPDVTQEQYLEDNASGQGNAWRRGGSCAMSNPLKGDFGGGYAGNPGDESEPKPGDDMFAEMEGEGGDEGGEPSDSDTGDESSTGGSAPSGDKPKAKDKPVDKDTPVGEMEIGTLSDDEFDDMKGGFKEKKEALGQGGKQAPMKHKKHGGGNKFDPNSDSGQMTACFGYGQSAIFAAIFSCMEPDDCKLTGGSLAGGSANKGPVSTPASDGVGGVGFTCGGNGGAAIEMLMVKDLLWDPEYSIGKNVLIKKDVKATGAQQQYMKGNALHKGAIQNKADTEMKDK